MTKSNAIKRNASTIEETTEVLLAETSVKEEKEKKPVKKLDISQKCKNIKNAVYNSEYREFLSRDALAWFKLAICYCTFYVFLASFFVLMLLIFYQIVDLRTPTYYNASSVMNYRGVNPGLGFRPQLDPESELIKVGPSYLKENLKSLELFLDKYERLKNTDFIAAKGQTVKFNYEQIIENTPCSKDNNFGYETQSPCVIVKLNRIFGWTPKWDPDNTYNLNIDRKETKEAAVFVNCRGDGGVDRDNIKEIVYYSAINSTKVGGIPFRYFPYRNQESYLSPLVFVHFKDIASNTLINVECKAYAKNIDNSDKINLRGMVKFQLFV